MKNKFCDCPNLQEKTIHLIADRLLGDEQLKKLQMRYNDMKSNYDVKSYRNWQFSEGLKPFNGYTNTTAVPISIKHPDFIAITEPQNYKRELVRGAIGLDLPTWFNMSSCTKRIMFIAQDPLRSSKWYGDENPANLCCDAIVSSPFGLHDAIHCSKGNGGKRFNQLVSRLVEKENFGIYLTDCRKFFVYNQEVSKRISNTEVVRNHYREILLEEIKTVNPDLIVCFGTEARSYFQSLLPDRKEVLFMPHFSGTACGAIKSFFDVKEDDRLDIIFCVNLYADKIISYLSSSNSLNRQ